MSNGTPTGERVRSAMNSPLMNMTFRVMGVIAGAAILGGFAWMRGIERNQDKIILKIQWLEDNRQKDEEQDRMIEAHWKLLGFHRDQINSLRHDVGQPPVSWPNLE